MTKLRNHIGLTLAEVLIVVAIIVALSGVSFVAVHSYLRSLTKREYDDYAKEIFIAAQNHLTMVKSLGYLELEGKENAFGNADGNDHYFIVNWSKGASGSEPKGTFVSAPDTLLYRMLPYGSLDETIRASNAYLIKYNKAAGTVLDVYYWSEEGGRYPHEYEANDYRGFYENQSGLDNYPKDGSVIGWYGGATALNVKTLELKAPVLRVYNEDRLYATVDDQLAADVLAGKLGAGDYTLTLTVKGKTSGAMKTFTLDSNSTNNDSRVQFDNASLYTVILDDVLSERHFCKLESDTPMSGFQSPFIPGEDVVIQAKVEEHGNNAIAAPQYAIGNSDEQGILTNSLYYKTPTEDLNKIPAEHETDYANRKAEIRNFRHLENLNPTVSGVAERAITAAYQTADLDWPGFIGANNIIYPVTASPLDSGLYLPVTVSSKLDYNGLGNTVTGVEVNCEGNAGLFGTLATDSKISNLKLVDFNIEGSGAAGALAGAVTGTKVENVLAINSVDSTAPTVTGVNSVGGLIGSAENSQVAYSAAALVVKTENGNAGGLIGTVRGASSISACYSGGHTTNGEYDASPPATEYGTDKNVYGTGAVGGLVGFFADSMIEYSYSTCSAYAYGGTAGGLAGTVSSGTVSHSYATGLVTGSTAFGAFAGSFSGTATDCWYYKIVNDITPEGETEAEYLGPVPGNPYAEITALDENAKTFNEFICGSGDSAERNPAVPYDGVLYRYYPSGKSEYPCGYGLLTVKQIMANTPPAASGDDPGTPAGTPATPTGTQTAYFVDAHYGDWPSPELWTVNDKPEGDTP